MSIWGRSKESFVWQFARAVGFWWLAAILNALAIAQEVGKRFTPNWDGVMPSEWLYIGGTALLMYGSYRAYRKVALERDALKPTVDLTVVFEAYPHRGGFQGANGAIIENVYIQDHTTPRDGNERGVLDFELILEWQDTRWKFDRLPFQQMYRQAAPQIQGNYFQIPWHIKKNRGAHLAFVERQPTLIPDEAWHNFTLRVNDGDSSQWFSITEPGRHRLTLGLDGSVSHTQEAISS